MVSTETDRGRSPARRRRRHHPFVISLLGIVLGGAFGVWGIHGYVVAPRPDRTVTGHFIDSPCSRIIEYVVEGSTYRLDLGARRCTDGRPGEEIEVSYESRNPEKSFAQGDSRWGLLGTGVLGMLVAVGTPIGTYSYRAHRRRRYAAGGQGAGPLG